MNCSRHLVWSYRQTPVIINMIDDFINKPIQSTVCTFSILRNTATQNQFWQLIWLTEMMVSYDWLDKPSKTSFQVENNWILQHSFEYTFRPLRSSIWWRSGLSCRLRRSRLASPSSQTSSSLTVWSSTLTPPQQWRNSLSWKWEEWAPPKPSSLPRTWHHKHKHSYNHYLMFFLGETTVLFFGTWLRSSLFQVLRNFSKTFHWFQAHICWERVRDEVYHAKLFDPPGGCHPLSLNPSHSPHTEASAGCQEPHQAPLQPLPVRVTQPLHQDRL